MDSVSPGRILLRDLVGARLDYDVVGCYPRRPLSGVVLVAHQRVVKGYRRCLWDARRAGDEAAEHGWRRSLREAHRLLQTLLAGGATGVLGWCLGLGPTMVADREEDELNDSETDPELVHPPPIVRPPDVDPRLVLFGRLAPPAASFWITGRSRAA
jgi:hypothetical protein